MSSLFSFPSFASSSNPSDVTIGTMDFDNPKIPKWTKCEYDKKDIYIDKNSGLVTSCIDDDPISIMGTWNPEPKCIEITTETKLYVKQLKSINVNCVIPPLKMAWLTDFTLVCPDRDIMVVKECLIHNSKVFKNILDSKSDDSFDVEFDSAIVFEVMKSLHAASPKQPPTIPIYMIKGTSIIERGIVSFCFRYEVEPLLTTLKAKINGQILNANAIFTLEFKSWLKFFHGFKNLDNSEPFRDQINLLLKFVVKYKFVEKYMEWINAVGKYDKDDLLFDYRTIISLLCEKPKNESNYQGCATERISIFDRAFPPPPSFPASR